MGLGFAIAVWIVFAAVGAFLGSTIGKMRGTWVEGSSSFLAGGIHTSIWLTSEIGTVAAFFFLWHSYKENNLNIGVEYE